MMLIIIMTLTKARLHEITATTTRRLVVHTYELLSFFFLLLLLLLTVSRSPTRLVLHNNPLLPLYKTYVQVFPSTQEMLLCVHQNKKIDGINAISSYIQEGQNAKGSI